jgi:protein-S-isoprenylcysteine O-methyltransferase Ste14
MKRKWGWRLALIFLIIFIAISISAGDKENIFSNSILFSSTPFLLFLGSALTVLGLAGAIWARTYLGRNWSGYVTYKENHELVTKGPYRFVRHPIYGSLLLMLAGAFIYYGSLLILMIFTALFAAFIARMRKEEQIMTKLFGKRYTDYKKRTKALIPFVL